MSLTSYRAAPPRGSRFFEREGDCGPGGDRLFRTLGCSTIGAEGFHGRVRDGIGCLAPRYGHQAGNCVPRRAARWGGVFRGCHVRRKKKCLWAVGPPFAAFAGTNLTGALAPLPAFAGTGLRGRGFCRYARRLGSRPIERLVPVSSTDYSAFTSGLSTWWSSTALGETWF